MTQKRLAGKKALVTGAGSGLGRTSALAMAQEGAAVLVTDIHAGEAEITAQLIHKLGGEAHFIGADVTKPDQVRLIFEKLDQEFGALHLALNNAGVDGVRARLAEYPDHIWKEVMAVNVDGVFYCLKEELSRMAKAGMGGSIINMSSVAGMTGFPGHAAYTASKHAVVGLTRTAALDYAKYQVRVNAICPAYTSTPMVQRMIDKMPGLEQKLNERVPLGRIGKPEEIAEAVIYLFSDASAFMTGQTMVLDGGILAE